MLVAETLHIDQINKRLVLRSYSSKSLDTTIKEIISLAQTYSLEKIWVWVYFHDVNTFKDFGFEVEGVMEANSSDKPGISMAYYVKPERSESLYLEQEDSVLLNALSLPSKSLSELPKGYILKSLTPDSCEEISYLLTTVLASYPTPVHKPAYIVKLMKEGCLFGGFYYKQKLVSVAAAYPEQDFSRYEMTDCATLSDHRGQSLTERIINLLEAHIQAQHQSYRLYSLARAGSFGMNRVLHNLGYNYSGRLINNCMIGGRYEDMNLWVK